MNMEGIAIAIPSFYLEIALTELSENIRNFNGK